MKFGSDTFNTMETWTNVPVECYAIYEVNWKLVRATIFDKKKENQNKREKYSLSVREKCLDQIQQTVFMCARHQELVNKYIKLCIQVGQTTFGIKREKWRRNTSYWFIER